MEKEPDSLLSLYRYNIYNEEEKVDSSNRGLRQIEMLYFLEQCFRMSQCAENSLLNNFVLLFQNYTQKVLGI